MAAASVRIHGLRELNRALTNLERKDLGKELKEAAEPVVSASREKVTRFRGSSPGTIRAKRTGLRVFVEQSKAKVTGKRGDFGALQMRTALEPALQENENEVFRNVEQALNRWGREEGF